MDAPNTQSWLEDYRAIRGIFVIITLTYPASQKLYLSNVGYISKDSTLVFNPIIKGGIQITESISLDGSTQMSFGDIEIDNTTGSLDSWLNANQFIFVNSSIQVYIGDPQYVVNNEAGLVSNFRLLFNGVVSDIDSKDRLSLNLKVRDKLERLNTPMLETKLGDVSSWGALQTNKDTIIPVVLGEVFNMSPLLINPTKLEYQFNVGQSEEVIEIRDNGVPIYNSTITYPTITAYATTATTNYLTCITTAPLTVGKLISFSGTVFGGITADIPYWVSSIVDTTKITLSSTVDLTTPVVLSTATGTMTLNIPGVLIDLVNSKFLLGTPLIGTCTMSLKGVKASVNSVSGETVNVYNNNICNAIAYIVTNYGKASTRLAAVDLDMDNFYSLISTQTNQSFGIVISDYTNILTVCQELASSIGLQLFMNRQGKLQLLGLYNTFTATVNSINTSDVILNSLNISAKTEVVASTKLGFCKNWTVQSNLTTGIQQQSKDIFAREWVTETITDEVVRDSYKLNTDVPQQDTLLIKYEDATYHAERVNNYFNEQKIIYRFTGTPKLFSLALGQQVNIVHPRFNLYNNGVGIMGQVITLSPNWKDSLIEVEVIV